jgi:beta-phosphoglucomutase-like phosphatase (HAD superfamily)
MHSQNKVKILIFDFDGVIVESNNIKDQAFEIIFKRYPKHYNQLIKFHRDNVSVSRYEKFDYLLKVTSNENDVNLKSSLLEDFSLITLNLIKTVPFVEGVVDFLQSIHNKIPVYLASVTPIADLESILLNLKINAYFKKVYGCPPWVKSDAIAEIIRTENVLPVEVLLIGDSYGDQRAAKINNINFIGRDSGLSFEKPYPLKVISNFIGFTL